MKLAKLNYTIQAFLRREYFDPDVLRALLVTIGLVVPLVVAHLLGYPLLGSFAAITAQLLLAAKIQTTYPQKALILFIFIIFISLTPLIGTWAGAHFWLTIICMAVIAGASSLAKELGAYGQVLGLCGVILFLISLPGPHSIEIGFDRMVAVWCGGLWAAFLLLLFWPFRADLPYYTNLALPWEISSNLAALLAYPPADNDTLEEQGQQKEITLRNAINSVLPFLRKKSRRYFFIRRDLLKIVRASSRFGATTLAMFANLENLRQPGQNKPYLIELQVCFAAAAAAARSVANALVLGREQAISELQNCISQLSQSVATVQLHLEQSELEVPAKLDLHRLIILLQSAIHYLQDAHFLLLRIQKKKEINAETPTTRRPSQLGLSLFVRRLFRFRNVPFKHTLRIMLLTALSISLYYGFNIPRGYWIALTIMVVLQPDYGTTQQKALQRVTGTSIGAILSTLLLLHPLPQGFLIGVIAIFCFFFVYLQPRNYTVSVVFVTMMLVAMFEVSGPIDWHIAAYRFFATVLGGVLAVVGAFLLWPDWERSQVRGILASGLKANHSLLLQLEHELEAQTGFHARIIADRRKAESANLAIGESVKRLQLEPGTKKQKLQIAQNIAFYNTRLTRELMSLGALLPSVGTNETFPEAITVMQQYTRLVADLIASIKTEVPFTETIPVDLPFPADLHVWQQPPAHLSANRKKQLHLDAETLKAELLHEQLNKIALSVQALGKAVQELNNL